MQEDIKLNFNEKENKQKNNKQQSNQTQALNYLQQLKDNNLSTEEFNSLFFNKLPTNDRIVRVPNKLFEYLKEDRYLITAMLAIYLSQNMNTYTTFSINSILKSCGLTPNRGKGRNIESIKTAIVNLIYLGYFEFANKELNNFFEVNFIAKHGDYRQQIIDQIQSYTQISIKPHKSSEINNKDYTLITLSSLQKLIVIAKQSKHSLIDFVNIYVYLKHKNDLAYNIQEKANNVDLLKSSTHKKVSKKVSLSKISMENALSYNKKTILAICQELENNGMIETSHRTGYSNLFKVTESEILRNRLQQTKNK